MRILTYLIGNGYYYSRHIDQLIANATNNERKICYLCISSSALLGTLSHLPDAILERLADPSEPRFSFQQSRSMRVLGQLTEEVRRIRIESNTTSVSTLLLAR
jgi:hypothetical protein